MNRNALLLFITQKKLIIQIKKNQ